MAKDRGRRRGRPSEFAYVDSHGEGHLKVADAADIREAIARFEETEFEGTVARERARLRILVEAEQHVDLVARPLLRLIDLVAAHEPRGEMPHCRERRVLDDDGRVERVPRVHVEPAADHLGELGPLVVGVERGVNADEPLAVLFHE